MYFHFVVGLGCPPTVHIIYNMLKKLFINWVLQWSPLKFLESPLKLKQLICFIVGCSAKLIYIYIYIYSIFKMVVESSCLWLLGSDMEGCYGKEVLVMAETLM
jgi:hypothetical protein